MDNILELATAFGKILAGATANGDASAGQGVRERARHQSRTNSRRRTLSITLL
jgi:hypothetical protein